MNNKNIIRILNNIYQIKHLSPFTLTQINEPELPNINITNKKTYTIPFTNHTRLHHHTITTTNEHKTDEQKQPEITILIINRAPNHNKQQIKKNNLL